MKPPELALDRDLLGDIKPRVRPRALPKEFASSLQYELPES